MSSFYMIYIEFEKFCVLVASVIETSYIKASKWTVKIKMDHHLWCWESMINLENWHMSQVPT